MNTPNIGWLYYKDYLRVDTDPARIFQKALEDSDEGSRNKNFEKHFVEKNRSILSQMFLPDIANHLSIVSQERAFSLKTTYPGLTLGTGYSHETGELGEFKLGFFFDHTTGYPCIPGSTVKGCLRSLFPQKERKDIADKDEKYNYLAFIIRNLPDLPAEDILDNKLSESLDQTNPVERKQFIDILEREIFDGEYPDRNENGSIKTNENKIVYKPIGIYERDIFFDAYPISTDHPAITKSTYSNSNPFLSDDYITPHINRSRLELSPFTNPIPLLFLKILPKVTIQFQFDVKNGVLTKEQKIQLFRRILLDFGIGAKTNVGYGQFEEGFKESAKHERTIGNNPSPSEPENFTKKVTEGATLEAKVIDRESRNVKIIVNGKEQHLTMSTRNCPKNGTIVQVEITQLNKQKDILMVKQAQGI